MTSVLFAGRCPKLITIINRSEWPDRFIKLLCPWIAKQAGIDFEYEFLLRATKRKKMWRGRGWKYRQTITCARRVFPPCHEVEYTDSRYKWAVQHTWYGPIETLVHILAHECCHATTGNREKFRGKNGRINRAAMEFHCNEFAQETILKFRKEWPKLRKQLRKAG